jgi:hypothetical protein
MPLAGVDTEVAAEPEEESPRLERTEETSPAIPRCSAAQRDEIHSRPLESAGEAVDDGAVASFGALAGDISSADVFVRVVRARDLWCFAGVLVFRREELPTSIVCACGSSLSPRASSSSRRRRSSREDEWWWFSRTPFKRAIKSIAVSTTVDTG